MMIRIHLCIAIFLIGITHFSQSQQVPIIEVPNEIEFAGIKLKLDAKAKAIIQKDITAIARSPKHFQAHVERANMYFPIIEKVFEEEGFPKDFKYLALQESSLIPDAISKSNAVGYWQFKKESAVEVGLRVDSKIDERMNIIVSSRGAARYLKRNNQTLENWVYALLSYNLGLGGVKLHVNQSYIGASKMPIDETTHWYVLRFLAHKLVYQHAIGNSTKVDSVLVEYINGSNKSLSDIALEHNLDKDRLLHYNKWLKSDVIPNDKIYPVVLAVPMAQAATFAKVPDVPKELPSGGKAKREKFPTVTDIDFIQIGDVAYTLYINGVKAIMARNGDNSVRLSAQGGISKQMFLAINELKSFEEVLPGNVYYLKKKKAKAIVLFHTVQYGETILGIAQNYGIMTKSIRDKNRMSKNEAIVAGRVLWLRKKRPNDTEVEYKVVERKSPPAKIPQAQTYSTETPVTISPSPVAAPLEIDTQNYVYQIHQVQLGETMFGIARNYQTSTDSILTWNKVENYQVKVGQKLIVNQKVKQVNTIHYIVVGGDTFYKIAKQFGVPVSALMQWNNKADTNVKLGEKLIIQKK